MGFRHWGLPSRQASNRARLAKFANLRAHCADVEPITLDAFVERQDRLARTLHELGASAYIAEPGASAGYYANIFGSSWGLSERPLLLVLTVVEDDGEIKGQVSILSQIISGIDTLDKEPFIRTYYSRSLRTMLIC